MNDQSPDAQFTALNIAVIAGQIAWLIASIFVTWLLIHNARTTKDSSTVFGFILLLLVYIEFFSLIAKPYRTIIENEKLTAYRIIGNKSFNLADLTEVRLKTLPSISIFARAASLGGNFNFGDGLELISSKASSVLVPIGLMGNKNETFINMIQSYNSSRPWTHKNKNASKIVAGIVFLALVGIIFVIIISGIRTATR